MKYGDLVTSLAHIPEAQGPYMVLHEIQDYYVCISLDNRSSINIPVNKVVPFRICDEVLTLLATRNQP